MLLQRPWCRVRMAERIRALLSSLHGDHAGFQDARTAPGTHWIRGEYGAVNGRHGLLSHPNARATTTFAEGSVLTFRSRQGEDTLCLFGVGPEFRPCPPGTSSTDLEQVRAEFGRLHACVRRLCLE